MVISKINSLKKINLLKNNFKFNSLSGNKSNLFKYCKNNTDDHELTKFKIFTELIKKDFEVLTEPEFKNNLGRPDIVCFDKEGNGHIFEIINSEKKESLKDKLNKYPIQFEIHFIYSNKIMELTI